MEGQAEACDCLGGAVAPAHPLCRLCPLPSKVYFWNHRRSPSQTSPQWRTCWSSWRQSAKEKVLSAVAGSSQPTCSSLSQLWVLQSPSSNFSGSAAQSPELHQLGRLEMVERPSLGPSVSESVVNEACEFPIALKRLGFCGGSRSEIDARVAARLVAQQGAQQEEFGPRLDRQCSIRGWLGKTGRTQPAHSSRGTSMQHRPAISSQLGSAHHNRQV